MTSSNHIGGDENYIHERKFDWTMKDKGMILSSFFYGYAVAPVFGGWLSNRYGGAKVCGIGIFLAALLTTFTPVVAEKFDRFGVLILRVFEGLFEGVAPPATFAVMARWAPLEERGRMISIILSGSSVGTFLAMPLCGALAEHFGWASMFYTTGGIGVLWALLWLIFAKDKPEDDPWITKEELSQLQNNITISGKEIVYPLREMATSMPLWALFIGTFSEFWGYFTLYTLLPTFLMDVYKFGIGDAGALSGLPYLMTSIMYPISGYTVDYLRRKNVMTITQICKVFYSGSFVIQSGCLMYASIFASGPIEAMIVISLGLGISCFANIMLNINTINMAPLYSPIVAGLGTMFLSMGGMIAPAVSGFVVINKTAEEWRNMFIISVGVYVAGIIFYCLFASGEEQPWSKSAQDKKVEVGDLSNTTITGVDIIVDESETNK